MVEYRWYEVVVILILFVITLTLVSVLTIEWVTKKPAKYTIEKVM